MKIIISLIPAFLILGGFIFFWIWAKWFPKAITAHFRIKEKNVGIFTYFRPEVKRPILGWCSFYASMNCGEITCSTSWGRNKEDAEHQIKLYQSLRPLGIDD